MGQKRGLLDDDGPIAEEEQPMLLVNEQYAKRFEHNKRREELHRLQAKHPQAAARLARAQVADGEDTEASSSEDDDEDIDALADDTDKVLETLVKIRRQDPSIYNTETKFFGSDDEEEEGEDHGADERPRKKAKPLYLRDAIAKQALEQGDGSSSDDEDGIRADGAPTYTQEQQELKMAFLDAAEQAATFTDGAGDEGEFAVGLLKKKRRREGKVADDAAEPAGKAKQPVEQLLDEYFGSGGKSLDQGEAFLKSYILNKGWVDADDAGAAARGGSSGDGDDESDQGEEEDGAEPALEEDEEFLEEVDRFEAAYNFRYEEPGGATIVTHPRNIDGTVRKEDDRRKRARKDKAERKAAEQQQREQELRRLKNLKMGEIQDRLAQIQAVAGKSAPQDDLVDALMDEDWDPDKYDAAMAAAFNDDYYEAGEEDDPGAVEGLSSDLEGEELEREEEGEEALAGTSGDGFKAVHKKLQAMRQDGKDEGDDASDEEADGEVDAEELARQRAEIQRMMEEYYKLDYEDNIDGLRCRFRYREVPKATGGLSVEDILTLPDKELNQVVGLKKLAPYREDGTKVRPNYKALQSLKSGTGANGENVSGKEWHRHWKGRKQGQQDGQRGQEWQQQWPKDGKSSKQGGKAAGKHGHSPAANGVGKGASTAKRPEQHGKQWQDGKNQHPGHNKQQQQQQLGGMTEEERFKARQQSYAKLTLNRGGPEAAGQNQQGIKRKREEEGQQQAPATPAGNEALAGLTKAQRKNYKRSLKRGGGKASAGA